MRIWACVDFEDTASSAVWTSSWTCGADLGATFQTSSPTPRPSLRRQASTQGGLGRGQQWANIPICPTASTQRSSELTKLQMDLSEPSCGSSQHHVDQCDMNTSRPTMDIHWQQLRLEPAPSNAFSCHCPLDRADRRSVNNSIIVSSSLPFGALGQGLLWNAASGSRGSPSETLLQGRFKGREQQDQDAINTLG